MFLDLLVYLSPIAWVLLFYSGGQHHLLPPPPEQQGPGIESRNSTTGREGTRLLLVILLANVNKHAQPRGLMRGLSAACPRLAGRIALIRDMRV